MKKIILSLSVCLMVLLFSSCDNKDSKVIVEIPDANFKTYLLENFDKNSDGNISLSEAKAIKDINCSGKYIADLTGIEKFENLESLDCSNNELNELEVRYNRKLNKLVCNGNNEPLYIYIGMTSPLKHANVKTPNPNEPPKDVSMMASPLDESKCTYDKESTNVVVCFDD